jgi:uncharacterized glyoxalase superfamily protein PhnB
MTTTCRRATTRRFAGSARVCYDFSSRRTLLSDTCDPAVRAIWPLLLVREFRRSLEFYRNQLGFEPVEQARDGEDVYWCRLVRGGATLMLQQAESEDAPLAPGTRGVLLYVVCAEVDDLYREFQSRGLVMSPPQITHYGMKQIFVPEPDGYALCFESPA